MSHTQRSDTRERPFGVPAQRTPVQFDPATGGLRIGAHERRVDPSQPGSVYDAYLSLLYAVRGAKPGQRLPLRAADLEALLLIVGDDPGTIEQRLVGLMGCSADEAKALSGILLRHRRLTATLGVAATLSLGAAGVGDLAGDAPAGTGRTHAAVAPADAAVAVQSRSSGEPEAPAPTAADLAPSGTTSVVVATAAAPVLAPARARTAAPPPPPARPAPAAAAPAAAPAAPAPVAAAPPPVGGDLPDADIGDPAYEEGVPPEQIGGVADPSIGHEEPVAQPDVTLPFPNAPRVEVVIGPELVVPVEQPEDAGRREGDEPKA